MKPVDEADAKRDLRNLGSVGTSLKWDVDRFRRFLAEAINVIKVLEGEITSFTEKK